MYLYMYIGGGFIECLKQLLRIDESWITISYIYICIYILFIHHVYICLFVEIRIRIFMYVYR
jgi:hypothetical protein